MFQLFQLHLVLLWATLCPAAAWGGLRPALNEQYLAAAP